MNRNNTTSPCFAPAIRAAALAVVLFAVVGPQPATARPMALMYAEAAAWMRAERVGHRTSNVEQSGTAAEAVGWAEWNESHHRNSGGHDGIRLGKNVTRLYGHTHPYGLPTGPSDADFNALRTLGRRSLGQRHSYWMEGGLLSRFAM